MSIEKTRFRNVMLTIWQDLENIQSLCSNDKTIFTYYNYQLEECPETKKKHIQFYGELNKQKSGRQLKKFFNDNTIHIEVRKGTQEQAIGYCSKLDTRIGEPVTFGTPRVQGRRSDITQVRADAKAGRRLVDIIDDLETPNFQTIRCAQILKSIYSRARTEKPYVMWIYGGTGLGKTRFVYDKWNIDDIYIKNMTKWWDGYEQHEVVLVDDYRRDFCKFHELLTLTDRYPCQREIKGGTVQINSKFIIFTSPRKPQDMWENRTTEDLKQLMRRVDRVVRIEDLLSENDGSSDNNKIDCCI